MVRQVREAREQELMRTTQIKKKWARSLMISGVPPMVVTISLSYMARILSRKASLNTVVSLSVLFQIGQR